MAETTERSESQRVPTDGISEIILDGLDNAWNPQSPTGTGLAGLRWVGTSDESTADADRCVGRVPGGRRLVG